MPAPVIDEKLFEKLLKDRLGESWARARDIFVQYGPRLSYDVANVLLHAASQGKAVEVIGILEEHFVSHLAYQHPDIRGTVSDGLLGVNPTQAMFLRLCRDTLQLQPNP